MQINPLKKPHS